MERSQLFYTGVMLLTLACLAAQLLRVSLQLETIQRQLGNLTSDKNWFKGVCYRRFTRHGDRLDVVELRTERTPSAVVSCSDPGLRVGDVHPFTADAVVSVGDL